MDLPSCTHSIASEDSPHQCHLLAERFLKDFSDHSPAGRDSPKTGIASRPDDEQLSVFEHDMIRPIQSLVDSTWDATPSSLIAQHCQSRPGTSTPYTDKESHLTEFVHELPDVHHLEKSEHHTPRPHILKIRRDKLEPASSDMYRMLKSVMNEFMVDFIGRHRVRIFLSFILVIGHLFKCIYSKSRGQVEVELVLKGGVSVRLWMLMLFDSMPELARNFAHQYVEKHKCVMFSDQDYDIIPIKASREQLRKVERLAFMTIIRLSSYWHRHRTYYFEFYEMSEHQRNQQLEKLLEKLHASSRVDGCKSIYHDMFFRHVVYEDEHGQTRVVPPLPSTDCLVRDGRHCWAGYKGTSRNSFMRICNIDKSWDPQTEDNWFLVDAQQFFHHEIESTDNHMQRCGYYDFQDRHHDVSFIYASYNTTCNTGTGLFALLRIMANFSFLCEQNVRLSWEELNTDQRTEYLRSNNIPNSPLAYLLYKPILQTYKIAIRIPGEVIDLANGHAFPTSLLNPPKRPTVSTTVFLNKVPVRITDISTLAEEQIRMVFKELNWTPWLYGGKTQKRTCRMMLLVTWSSILNVETWEHFDTAVRPLKAIRMALNELAQHTGHRAYSRRKSSSHRLLYRLGNSSGNTNIIVHKFCHEFLRCFEAYEEHAHADKQKVTWAKETTNFLDFALFIFFLYVARRLGFKKGTHRPLILPDQLHENQFDSVKVGGGDHAPLYQADATSLYYADPLHHLVEGDMFGGDSSLSSSGTSSSGNFAPLPLMSMPKRAPPLPDN